MSQNAPNRTPIYITPDALMAQGASLEDALIIASDAGVDGFELRREALALPMTTAEMLHLRELLARFPSPPIYSTAQALCCDQQQAYQAIRFALDEAAFWGCALMKCPIGDIGDLSASELALLQQTLCEWQRERPEVTLAVENAPVGAHTNLAQWELFFDLAGQAHTAVGMTFDLGNWQGQGVDVVQAAQDLGRYVRYAHVKAVSQIDGHWYAQPIHPSANQAHPALAYLPPHIPRAIEFPIPGSGAAYRDALHEYVEIIRSGDFTL